MEKIANKEFEKVDTTQDRICPNCGAKMVKNSTSIKKTIEVDDCYSCGGKFLDNEELIKIREEYENNEQRDADILKYVYSSVGKEMEEIDKNYAKSITNRNMAQKLFYRIMGL